MRAERLGDARPELVGLDEHGGQRVDVLDAGAAGEAPQGVPAGQSRPDLLVRQKKLIAQGRARDLDLLPNALEPRVQAKPRLHTHDEQVERVGERGLDLELPRLPLEVEPERGEIEPDQGRDPSLKGRGADRPGQRVIDREPSDAERGGKRHLGAQEHDLGAWRAYARALEARSKTLPALA